jgi:hypothetical protein
MENSLHVESVDHDTVNTLPNGYDHSHDDNKASSKELAERIWHSQACVKYRGTRLDSAMCGGGGHPGGYLGSRGIFLKVQEPNMRFHLGLKHGPTGEKFIAAVFKVSKAPDGELEAIHRGIGYI